MPEQPASWYDQVFATSAHYRLPANKCRYFPMWQQILPWLAGKHVLDLGCGPGQFGSLCLEAGINYRGVDFSPEAVRMAGNVTGRPELFTVDNAMTCPLGDADCIVMLEMLEHINDDLGCVSRVPAGLMVVLSVPFGGPSKAHVRGFSSSGEVAARYSPLVDIAEQREIGRSGRWFFLHGVRR